MGENNERYPAVERRAGNAEMLARMSVLEAGHVAQRELIERMCAGAVAREKKLDDLILLVGSGKGAIRILAWLGGVVMGVLWLLNLLRDYFTLRN